MASGPTMIIDRCQSAHQFPSPLLTSTSPACSCGSSRTAVGLDVDSDDEQQLVRSSDRSLTNSNRSLYMLLPTGAVTNYGSVARLRGPNKNKYNAPASAKESIRFQVVVWDVGPVDVALGRVPMCFRVTMFWDDQDETDDNNEGKMPAESSSGMTEWTMEGRRKAYERLVKDESIVRKVDVPPVSLLNVVTFDVIGQPEVCVLREKPKYFNDGVGVAKSRLMRWTCLYKATLMQHNMKLDNFPHDEHILSLKLGILVHRRPGGRWDMNKYRLDLATEDDSKHSTRVPHGLIVDHVRIPDFNYNPEEGLDFQFVPLSFGTSALPVGNKPSSKGNKNTQQDCCLEVHLRVTRDSGYYDQNIMPLIGLLNIVAVSIPLSLEGTYFFQRGLLLLNITFVQIGIRMNVDKFLPSVGYQIKMQKIMNQFFFSLLFLVLESSAVYVLNDRLNWSLGTTNKIDNLVASVALGHIVMTWALYYLDKVRASQRLLQGKSTAQAFDKSEKNKRRISKMHSLPV
jgi:hypothetical protein